MIEQKLCHILRWKIKSVPLLGMISPLQGKI